MLRCFQNKNYLFEKEAMILFLKENKDVSKLYLFNFFQMNIHQFYN